MELPVWPWVPRWQLSPQLLWTLAPNRRGLVSIVGYAASEVGKHLAERSMIVQRDDVFFLYTEEAQVTLHQNADSLTGGDGDPNDNDTCGGGPGVDEAGDCEAVIGVP